MNICYLIERAGPYHLFRLNALTGHDLSVIETNAASDQYQWKEQLTAGFALLSPQLRVPADLFTILDAAGPDVIFLTGYGFKQMLWGLAWATRNQVPVVMQSDSTELDSPRQEWKELIKKQLLANVQAAFVAGTRSRLYLHKLGIHNEAIFEPYDIVDNEFFASPAPGPKPEEGPYFLCVSRLIEAKNLEFLIRSFALFNQQQQQKFKLVILGNGPLEASLTHTISRLRLEGLVLIRGFLHMNEVRRYYQHATGLILASTSEPWGLCINEAMAAGLPVLASCRAGAAEDLINHTCTGWIFSPTDPGSLTDVMHACVSLSPQLKKKMILNARERLENFTIEKFITGVNDSASYALEHPGNGNHKKFRSFLICQIARIFS